MSTNTPPSSKPKAMSSRLLTMKFMQRAAASPTSSTTSPSTPDPADGPAAKRRRTDSGDSSPPIFDVNALADQRAIRAAIDSEEARRQLALEKQAAEAGDTRWVLNFKEESGIARGSQTMKVVQMGFAGVDRDAVGAVVDVEINEDEQESRPAWSGRRSFGKFNKVIEKLQDPEAEVSSSDEEEEGENTDSNPEKDDSDAESGLSALLKEAQAGAAEKLRLERKKKRKEERKEQKRMREGRIKKEVNINSLTSISNAGGLDVKGSSNALCYLCGGKGHMKKDCPKNGQDSRQRSYRK